MTSFILNKRKIIQISDSHSPIECGYDVIETEVNNQDKYLLKYYKIAILFLIFDLETVILFPFIGSTQFDHSINTQGIDQETLCFFLFNWNIFLFFLYFISIGLFIEYKSININSINK